VLLARFGRCWYFPESILITLVMNIEQQKAPKLGGSEVEIFIKISETW
jgi:hypothetical protein